MMLPNGDIELTQAEVRTRIRTALLIAANTLLCSNSETDKACGLEMRRLMRATHDLWTIQVPGGRLTLPKELDEK